MLPIEKCSGCEACLNICKKEAITMAPDINGFLYPKVDNEKCIQCGLCEQRCPVLHSASDLKEMSFYAARYRDSEKLKKVSSGGFATALSEVCLEKAYIVYGVAWDKDFRGAHYRRITSVNDLRFLSGTKYVQARKGKIYSEVKEDLDAGEKVVFFGLPCEVGGLLAFLRRPYNNLVTVQLVCHGVTSSKYIAEYCSRLEEKHKSKIVSFNLRDKKNGVDPKYIRVEFENGKVFSELLLASDFGATFVTCDRESCYDCHFKGESRVADITIGDYWGLSAEHKAWHNMGTSLVVTHTQKADDLVSSLKCDSDFMVCRGPEESARNGNPKMYRSGAKAENRQKMMDNISKMGLHRGIQASRNFKDYLKLVYYRYLPEWAKKIAVRIVK